MTVRRQRTEFLLEAARWFGWAADACRADDRVEAWRCGVTAQRALSQSQKFTVGPGTIPDTDTEAIAITARPTKTEGAP